MVDEANTNLQATKSPNRTWLLLGVAIAVLAGALVWRYGDQMGEWFSAGDPPSVIQAQAILERAQSALSDGRLVNPADDNAVYHFDEALRLDPENAAAKAGLEQVFERLAKRAGRLIKQQDLAAAQTDIDALSALRPNAPQAAALQQVLEQTRLEMKQATAGEQVATNNAAQPAEPAQEVTPLDAEAERARLIDQSLSAIDRLLSKENLSDADEEVALHLIERTHSLAGDEHPELIERVNQAIGRAASLVKQALETHELERAESLTDFIASLPVGDRSVESQLRQAIARARSPDNAVIEPARRLKLVQPNYPRNASRRGIEGWVHLGFVIDEKGSVSEVQVVESAPNDIFDRAAIEAVQQWRYTPRTVNGNPEQQPMEVKLRFQL